MDFRGLEKLIRLFVIVNINHGRKNKGRCDIHKTTKVEATLNFKLVCNKLE